LMPHLPSSIQASWADEHGWYTETRSPFPGSELLSVGSGASNSSVVAPLAVGVMLPALAAARRTARQMQSSTQARGIHQACVVFAQGARGNFPPDLATLYHGNFFTVEYLVSPSSGIHIPPDFRHWPKDEQTQWIHRHASYVLIPGLVEDLDARKVAVFEKPSHAAGDMIAVVFNDNHVRQMPVHEVAALIQQQTGKTMDQLIAEAEGRGQLN